MSEQPKSNILKALEGEAITTNQPESRILQAIKNGGGGGGGGSYDDLVRRIEVLENKQETFIATYHGSTAQEIIAFLDNNPHAPILVQNGDDVYSTIFSKKLAANKVMLRTIVSFQGKFNLFEYTVTDTAWNATTTSLYYDDAAIQAEITKNAQNIARIADFVGIDLTVEYLPLSANQGVIIDDGVGLDTGLKLNGNAIFRFKGCLKNLDNQACLIGARTDTSTTERTCINVLPVSGQIQSQWANNAYKVLKDDIDFLQPFDIIADKNQTVIAQNGVEISTIQNGGFSGINTETPICLFNQALDNAQYYSPVLQSAEIEIDGTTTTIEPMIKRNTQTGVESVVLFQNGVEMNISGLTLFEIQAA